MRSIVLTLTTLLLLTGGPVTFASPSHPADALSGGGFEAPSLPSAGTRQGSGMTLSEAVEQVRRQYNGRIVSAETIVSGGRETHVIKVLTEDGKVKTVRIPGRRL